MGKHAAKRKWLPIDYHKRINYIHSLFQYGVQVEYRSFGKLDWKASALGFGTMRLPIIGEDQAKVNEPEAIKLIRYAIDQGVNYIDSAFTYHDGNSEVTVGKALAGKYRKQAKVATKMPVYQVKTKQDLDRILKVQMKRLNTQFTNKDTKAFNLTCQS
jgi:predicted aldo/keto reductase-like oxidoreductase